LKTKIKQAQKFIKKGMFVKIVVLFRGREKKTMQEAAMVRLDRFAAIGKIVSPPKMQGNRMVMTVR
jgi:translation initiation factor IF-3